MPHRAWNTWDVAYPASFVHLPSGLFVRVAAYSTKENRYVDFGGGKGVTYGPHALDGSFAACWLHLAATRLKVSFSRPDPFAFVGKMALEEAGEWPLRFWFFLWVGFGPTRQEEGPEGTLRLEIPSGMDAYQKPPRLLARRGHRIWSLALEKRPVVAELWDDPSAFCSFIETKGYYARREEREGSYILFRFSGEDTPEVLFSLAQGGHPQEAAERAEDLLMKAPFLLEGGEDKAEAEEDEAYRALRDVLGWNTVFDSQNKRIYTAASRSWAAGRFGGYLLWLTDTLYHAFMAAYLGDEELALSNLEAVFAHAQPSGLLPGMMSSRSQWIDRSQPPIAAYILWRIFLRLRDKKLLQRYYPLLKAYRSFWLRERDGNGDGLLEYGSSPQGEGHFVHTLLAAKNESSMDNLPTFEGARFIPEAHTMDLADVGLNSLLCLQEEVLGKMARELGEEEEAGFFEKEAQERKERVREALWDGERQIFAGRFWDGTFTPHLAATSFLPLLAGIPLPWQAEAMIRQHLLHTETFWGERPLPATPKNDPLSHPPRYWRGRIWGPLVFLTWDGLRRSGYPAVARELAEKSLALFLEPWREQRHCHEHYSPDPSHPHLMEDVDPFYTWGALLPLLHLLERDDVSPWEPRRT
ncbi:MAG: trehalase family glycosidase [Bacillota bacterium]|nr:trehalase family glycosidase [Bacillota bacterium]